jgi:hypothetical protein
MHCSLAPTFGGRHRRKLALKSRTVPHCISANFQRPGTLRAPAPKGGQSLNDGHQPGLSKSRSRNNGLNHPITGHPLIKWRAAFLSGVIAFSRKKASFSRTRDWTGHERRSRREQLLATSGLQDSIDKLIAGVPQ